MEGSSVCSYLRICYFCMVNGTGVKGIQWKSLLLLYIDNVFIYLTDFDSHVERLENFLQQFCSSGLKLGCSKCELKPLKDFDFVIEHRTGKLLGNARGLSRNFTEYKQCDRIDKRDGGDTANANQEKTTST